MLPILIRIKRLLVENPNTDKLVIYKKKLITSFKNKMIFDKLWVGIYVKAKIIPGLSIENPFKQLKH